MHDIITMWCLTLPAVILLAVTIVVESANAVCYPHVGCFSNAAPFDNTNDLPASPESIDTHFWLYTKDTTDFSARGNRPYLLDYTDALSLQVTKFDVAKPGDFNVVVVDWRGGARWTLYNQAVANLRVVAKETKMLLDIMVRKGVSLDDVHLIGHSLGAHMAGIVGGLTGGALGRISAMEAAQEMYEHAHLEARVDKSDAKFVDAIHTDTSSATLSFGTREPIGHVDFYPNGGDNQPGCHHAIQAAKNTIKKTFVSVYNKLSDLFGRRKRNIAQVIACNHDRSHEYYTQTIKHASSFRSFPCESYEKYEKGECASCGSSGCSAMGYGADKQPGRGKQYLQTLDTKPYGGHPYRIVVTLDESKPRPIDLEQGKLTLKLEGQYGKPSVAVLVMANAKLDNAVIQGVVIFGKSLDATYNRLCSVQFQMEASDPLAASPLVVQQLEFHSLGGGKSYRSETGSYSLSRGPYDIPLKLKEDYNDLPIVG